MYILRINLHLEKFNLWSVFKNLSNSILSLSGAFNSEINCFYGIRCFKRALYIF